MAFMAVCLLFSVSSFPAPCSLSVCTFHIYMSHWGSSFLFCLPFPWCICIQHFPQYVFFFSPHHMPVPVQSSLRDIFGSLRHSRFPLDVFVPRLFIARHSAHPSLHPHRVSQDQISTPLCMPHGHRPLKEPILLLNNITIIEGSYKPNFSSVLLYK